MYSNRRAALEWREMEDCVHSNKNDGFPMVDKNDGGLNFKFPMILVHVTSCFTIQNPKKENHWNHHDDHPLWSNGQWQKTTNGNKLHCNVVSNSVIERIGEKKFCKRPFFTVEITILRTGSTVFFNICNSVDFHRHCTWPKGALDVSLPIQLSFSEG